MEEDMTKRNKQITHLYFEGVSARDLASQFNLSYSSIYNIVSSAESELSELKKEVLNLKNQLVSKSLEIRRLNEELFKITEQLRQSKTDNVKLLIKLNNLRKKLEGFNQQKEAEIEKVKEETEKLLCQESKVIAWQVWNEKA